MLASSPAVAASPEFQLVAREMVRIVRFLSDRGWTPATSANFSARIPGARDAIAISRSGVDKAAFAEDDVMIVDELGRGVWPETAKCSAETPLHLGIYELFDAGAVLHTHSLAATAFSLKHRDRRSVAFSGLELLKGLSGVTTHEARIEVPIFPNDQDMERLSSLIRRELTGSSVYGFLLKGHGLYTWGATLQEARRHLEVFEFLFDLALTLEDHDGYTFDS